MCPSLHYSINCVECVTACLCAVSSFLQDTIQTVARWRDLQEHHSWMQSELCEAGAVFYPCTSTVTLHATNLPVKNIYQGFFTRAIRFSCELCPFLSQKDPPFDKHIHFCRCPLLLLHLLLPSRPLLALADSMRPWTERTLLPAYLQRTYRNWRGEEGSRWLRRYFTVSSHWQN